MPDFNEAEQDEITDARNVLESYGFVILREKSYRQAQERQRVAECYRDAEIRAAESARSWARNCLAEERRLRERCTFLYGAARAAGCTVEQLRGDDGQVLDELDRIDADDGSARPALAVVPSA